jgi:hypothetical protein
MLLSLRSTDLSSASIAALPLVDGPVADVAPAADPADPVVNIDHLISRQQLPVLLLDPFGGFDGEEIVRRFSDDLRSGQPEQFFG